jgi:hypothetical protein
VRLRILDLPLEHPDTFSRFALVADQLGEPDEQIAAALIAFAEKIGAAGVLVYPGEVAMSDWSIPLTEGRVSAGNPLWQLLDTARDALVARLPPAAGSRIS